MRDCGRDRVPKALGPLARSCLRRRGSCTMKALGPLVTPPLAALLVTHFVRSCGAWRRGGAAERPHGFAVRLRDSPSGRVSRTSPFQSARRARSPEPALTSFAQTPGTAPHSDGPHASPTDCGARFAVLLIPRAAPSRPLARSSRFHRSHRGLPSVGLAPLAGRDGARHRNCSVVVSPYPVPETRRSHSPGPRVH